MSDQAFALRGLIQQQQAVGADAPPAKPFSQASTIAITSGKGGVGKSNIALNLAIALARNDSNVCLLDANLGLGNIDLLCGLNGYWNLSHVITGARTLTDIMLDGPTGIHVVPGASGLIDAADVSASAQREILGQLEELERTHDYLLIDTGTGIHKPIRRFLNAADIVLVVTTPEPTAIADAYATLKSLSTVVGPKLEVLVNQCESSQQGRAIIDRLRQTARLFINTDLDAAGFIPHDPHVPRAVIQRTPFVVEAPLAPASQAIAQLARRMKNIAASRTPRGEFFANQWDAPQSEAA
jgi:flagellar biosynthesis protein FlhG